MEMRLSEILKIWLSPNFPCERGIENPRMGRSNAQGRWKCESTLLKCPYDATCRAFYISPFIRT
jgi:hypothetical protein